MAGGSTAILAIPAAGSGVDCRRAGLEVMQRYFTNPGRAELPLCPNLPGSKHSDADGIPGQILAWLIVAKIQAARQRRPTLEAVSAQA